MPDLFAEQSDESSRTDERKHSLVVVAAVDPSSRAVMRRTTRATSLAVNIGRRHLTGNSMQSDDTYNQTWSSLGDLDPQVQWPASAYNVLDVSDSDMLAERFCSRHITFAPSPSGSVHRSEYGIQPYSEVYGVDPDTFEFDARGNKIPVNGTLVHCDVETHENLLAKLEMQEKPGRQANLICLDRSKPAGSVIYNFN